MVVVAYRILPEAVYSLARKGAFNLHGSLLPAFRGAAPIHRAVMAGVKETGVTTFFLKKEVDTGDVILRASTLVGANETAGDVYERLMYLGADLVVQTVRMIKQGPVPTLRQDDRLVSPAPKIFPDDCYVDWTKPAQVVHNFIRGLSPFPGARTMLDGKLLKLYRSEVVADNHASYAPGTILINTGKLLVACGTGMISLIEVQLEGRKRLPASAFLAGKTDFVGSCLVPRPSKGA
ncbi:MAG TPA: methionyl-tRNA formyltransferase, partial [Rhodothermales bacterium]|nr:methionyl-tRNA formyltransferase [Rhodothermales bacterium]